MMNCPESSRIAPIVPPASRHASGFTVSWISVATCSARLGPGFVVGCGFGSAVGSPAGA
jgi:hypothetical protein